MVALTRPVSAPPHCNSPYFWMSGDLSRVRHWRDGDNRSHHNELSNVYLENLTETMSMFLYRLKLRKSKIFGVEKIS